MKKKMILVLSLSFGFFSVLAIILSFSISANAKSWEVRPGESIQAYIDDPNVVTGDEIILNRGIYIENIKFINIGKAIIVRSIDPRDPNCVANTIIDGNYVDSVITFYNNGIQNSVISGLTLKQGKGFFDVSCKCYCGGGIYCFQSSAIIENCIISENKYDGESGSYGGGIYCYRSSPIIRNCIIKGNKANREGGGIYCNNSSAKIIDCTIVLNNVTGVTGHGGGICCLNSSLEVDKCTINKNWAYWGGGIHCSANSKPNFTNCVIAFNEAYSEGGGIYCGNPSSIDNSYPTIINSTICFNMAKSRGAGIFSAYHSYYKSLPIITNSILWGDTINGDPNGIYYIEELYIKNYNSFLTTVTYSDIQMPPGQIYPGERNINVDPLFADIMGHLLPFSPCIDANTDPNIVLTVDKDGNSRPQDGEIDKDGVKKYDMGAYEFPSDYEMPDVRLPEYITTHFTATVGDDLQRFDQNNSKREEGYFNPFYGKDADDRWMNWDKHGHPWDSDIKPSYNNYHNQITCNNAIKVKYDEFDNPINDDNNDGIPNEIEAFEQAVFQATGSHCDILNFTPHVNVECYLIENHPNIQIVNNVIWDSSLITVIFPPFWRKDGSYPVLLLCPGFYIDLNAMYLLEDERRFAIWVGQSAVNNNTDSLIVIRSNTGGWETEGFHESAIRDIGSFLEAMAGFGADTSRIITFKESGSRGGGNAALIWGANPYKDDYNVSSRF